MTLMFPTIFLNSPAIFFAVVNILRIWEDFKCLCLSGLFLQKHSRTVFWQQEAYKNLEKKKIKKIKRLKRNGYERNAPVLPYPKSAKQSRVTSRKNIFLLRIRPQFVQSGCSLGHPCDCPGGARGNAFVTRDSPLTPGRCRVWSVEIGLSVASFLLHFSVC